MSEELYPHFGTLVIVCAGSCGKTTEEVDNREFWEGEVRQAKDPEERVPIWTCKECVANRVNPFYMRNPDGSLTQ